MTKVAERCSRSDIQVAMYKAGVTQSEIAFSLGLSPHVVSSVLRYSDCVIECIQERLKNVHSTNQS